MSESITAAPEIALDATGNAVAIGLRDTGPDPDDTLLEAVERSAGGDWSDSVVISDPGENLPGDIQLGVDAAGNPIAVWGAFSGSGYVIRTASRAAGEWSEPDDLSINAFPDSGPHLAINAHGDAVAVWVEFDDPDRVVVAAVRPAGGEWSDPEGISADGEDGRLPQVGIDGEGNAIAVWELDEPVEGLIQTASRLVDGEWSDPEDLSAGGDNAGAPRIAMNEDGDAVAAWNVTAGDLGIHARTRSEGDWSDQEDVSDPGEEVAGDPEVAIDSNGAVATWLTDVGGGEEVVRGSVLPADEDEWSEPEDLSFPANEYRSTAVATNSAAGAIAIWTRNDGSTNWVQAAVRPPAGDWSQPDDLSDVGEEAGLASLAFDPAGNAIGIWGREAGDDEYVAEAAGYDFAAPRLDALQIPATGTAGASVAFAVSPFDVFPLGATNWTFGDGSGASGNAVSHVFAAPGIYPVTVTAIDGGGNVSSQKRTITIAAAPRVTLSLRIKRKSLGGLLRSGKLSVVATVSDPASVNLKGRARLRVGQGKARKLISVFETKTVRFGTAGERELQLTLTDRGRKKLQSLFKARIVVGGEANAGVANVASSTAAKTLSNPKR